MEYFNKNYHINIKDIACFEHKLNQYFEYYGFENNQLDSNKFYFFKKGTLLDGWKINPLNWESQIEISLIKSNRISINYTVAGNAQMNSKKFAFLFDAFIENLTLFINQNSDFRKAIKPKIISAKKKTIGYFGLIMLGAIIGLLAGLFISKISGISSLGYAAIVLGALITHKFHDKLLFQQTGVA